MRKRKNRSRNILKEPPEESGQDLLSLMHDDSRPANFEFEQTTDYCGGNLLTIYERALTNCIESFVENLAFALSSRHMEEPTTPFLNNYLKPIFQIEIADGNLERIIDSALLESCTRLKRKEKFPYNLKPVGKDEIAREGIYNPRVTETELMKMKLRISPYGPA